MSILGLEWCILIRLCLVYFFDLLLMADLAALMAADVTYQLVPVSHHLSDPLIPLAACLASIQRALLLFG